MATLGQQLKQTREDKGITLHDIATTTHIGVRFLQAIENDTYDILPGGVFNRAFVRKFAKQVGLDEEQAIKLYEEQLEEQGGEQHRRYEYGIEDFEAKPSSGNGLLLSFVALLILSSLAYLAYQYFAPSVSDPNTNRAAGSSTPTPAPTMQPTPAVSASPNRSPVVSPSPSLLPSPSPSPVSLQAIGPDGAMRVQFVATGEEVWLSVKPDAGKTEQITLQPGDTREFNVTDKVVLYIGRVPSLRIIINGRNVDYGKLLPYQRGTVASNVVITKDNYQQYLN